MAKDDSSNVTGKVFPTGRPHRLFENGTGNKSATNAETLNVRRDQRMLKSAPLTYKGK